MEAESEVRDLIDNPRTSRPEDLAELFAALAPASTDFMIGSWRGGALSSGHKLDGVLDKARWVGKNFVSEREVQPLVCLDDDGRAYSNTELGNGEATLRNVEFDGRVTAAMVYDGQPVIDHFVRVDDRTVMGIMTGKHITAPYFYFYLERNA